jgi:PIN domain nuclease of toxin-antitoxin system
VKLLLDTHIWLWALLEPERLSPRVRELLIAPNSELWLSPISVWEALLLAERGRIRVEGSPTAWVEQLLARLPRREAPLTSEVAVASRAVILTHQDPADRFLAATANVFDLTLVTADERLLGGDGFDVMANA